MCELVTASVAGMTFGPDPGREVAYGVWISGQPYLASVSVFVRGGDPLWMWG